MLISLFGATAGQGVVWYTGQFYALFYLQTILKVPAKNANIIIAIALLLAMPFFTLFGALSDRVGRKWLMMAACLLAVLTYIPIYKGMQSAAGNNVVGVSSAKNKVTGATTLTAMTVDTATGSRVPAKEATNANTTDAGFSGVPSGHLCLHDLWPYRGLSCRGLPCQNSLHLTLASLPHWQWSFRRLTAADWLMVVRGHRKYLCGLVLPDDCRRALLSWSAACSLRETHGTKIWSEVATTPQVASGI